MLSQKNGIVAMNLNSAYRTEVNNILSQHNSAHAVYRADRKRYSESKKAFRIYKEAQTIIQEVAQEVQSNAHSKIAAVVSKCLQAVFDDPYEFKIHFEQKRGKTEARLTLCRDGMELNHPLDAVGGGVADVVGFALRVSSLLMSRPRLQRILASDEPFRFVSKEYWGHVREMLETISKEMGIQIIQVTHNEELKTGKLFHIGEEE